MQPNREGACGEGGNDKKPTGKVKVKCNQTGKVLVVKVAELTDENDEPICFEELEEGFNVFWTVNELSYPVTVLRLLGNSKPV